MSAILTVSDWLFIAGYWQPVAGIMIGLIPYIWVIKRHGWNRQSIYLWESYALAFGGIMIVLGIMYLGHYFTPKTFEQI